MAAHKLLLIIILSLVCLLSCSKKNNPIETIENTAPPSIKSFSPKYGTLESQVKLYGNFNINDTAKLQVYIGNILCKKLYQSDSLISIIIPRNTESDKFKVVNAFGETISNEEFIVMPFKSCELAFGNFKEFIKEVRTVGFNGQPPMSIDSNNYYMSDSLNLMFLIPYSAPIFDPFIHFTSSKDTQYTRSDYSESYKIQASSDFIIDFDTLNNKIRKAVFYRSYDYHTQSGKHSYGGTNYDSLIIEDIHKSYEDNSKIVFEIKGNEILFYTHNFFYHFNYESRDVPTFGAPIYKKVLYCLDQHIFNNETYLRITLYKY